LRVLLLQGRVRPACNLIACLEDEGLVVDAAHDGRDGDRKARATGYAAVVLDLLLPGCCPVALLEGWRRDGLGTPVLALAAGDGAAERVRCLDAGADDCLARPFRLREVTARLRALLRRCFGAASPLIRTFDLELDTTTRTVRRAGRDIRLTQQEYALLELLAVHRGRVVTRALIREHLYDEDDEVNSNVVNVYVGYLRNKIDRGFDPPLLVTRWGQGYLLRADDTPPPKDRRRPVRTPPRAPSE
jgi:DNA-binding response OmpR family regulator